MRKYHVDNVLKYLILQNVNMWIMSVFDQMQDRWKPIKQRD